MPHKQYFSYTPYAGIIQIRFKGYLLSLRGTPESLFNYIYTYTPNVFNKSRHFIFLQATA